MRIILSYNRFINVKNHTNDTPIEVPDNCTVLDLMNFIELPGYLQRSIIAHINNEAVWNSTQIQENDKVKQLRAISGG